MSGRIPDVGPRVVEVASGVRSTTENGRRVLRRTRFTGLRAAFLRILRQPTDFTVRLDPMAAAAWDLFDGHRTVAEVREELQRRFPGESDIGLRLGRFLGTLVSHHMVTLR